MNDYINRKAFLDAIENGKNYQQDADDIAEMLQNFPAADVRPVKRGKWISHDFVDMGKGRYTGSVECSVCNRFLPLKEHYCPNCGFDMREEQT